MKLLSKISAAIICVAMFCGLMSSCGDDKITIGICQFGEFDALTQAYNGFVDGLKEKGYEDGKNIKLIYQSAAGDTNNCPTIANSLINNGCDLILAIATPAALAVKAKTTTIPTLITAVTDPAASGIVASNTAPGGNITGSSDLNPVEKQVDLLTELLPDVQKVAVLYCSSEGNSKIQYDIAKAALEAKGLTCVEKTISEISEVKSLIEAMPAEGIEAIYIPTDNTIAGAMTAVSSAATSVGLPTITGEGGMIKDGGLASIALDYYELGKETGRMAAKIIEGADPATMPIYFQTEDQYLKLHINKDTARTLGITIPQSMLDKAITYPAE